MANRSFTQFNFSLHKMPVVIDCDINIGATGAVTSFVGPGVNAVTRLAAGVYRINLQDDYYKWYSMEWIFNAPLSGTNVADGAFVVGTPYQITTVGTTNWQNVGLPVGITPTVGCTFVATTVGGAGTGQAQAFTSSGIFTVEMIGNQNQQLATNIGTPNVGAYLYIKCLNAAGAATDPASGSTLGLMFYLSNSSIVVQGE